MFGEVKTPNSQGPDLPGAVCVRNVRWGGQNPERDGRDWNPGLTSGAALSRETYNRALGFWKPGYPPAPGKQGAGERGPLECEQLKGFYSNYLQNPANQVPTSVQYWLSQPLPGTRLFVSANLAGQVDLSCSG